MGVKERLVEFLKSIPIAQGRFEEEVNLSNGFVNNIGDTIRKKSLDKIIAKYPELNTVWLLTGEGEMKKGSVTIHDTITPRILELQATILGLADAICTKSQLDKFNKYKAFHMKVLASQLAKENPHLLVEAPELAELVKTG